MQQFSTTFKYVMTLLFSFVITLNSFSQVTTSSINGLITDEKGEGLPGATVQATHVPSGTKYGVSTRADGRYTLPNVRVGGPYLIQASFVGYKTSKTEVSELKLGVKFIKDFKLAGESSQLQEIVVKTDAVLNSQRTGAATNITAQQLAIMPTVTRGAFDFVRKDPTFAENGSFGGRNSQFNNFAVDGAIFNNPFGLDAARPGGQSDAEPISPDAIEQYQVSSAPFDVTQAGFTGASVNAVTKSGTNDVHGTAYGFFRNQSLTGGKVAGAKIFVPDLSQFQAGFSLGGPIVKDKLFFFANLEIDRRSDLGSSFLAARPGLSGSNVSRVTAADLELVSSTLSKFGYQTGAYENYTEKTNNTKGILKLDWNISPVHKLTATYNFLDASKDKTANPSAIGRRGPDFLTLQFFNSGYRINNKLNSTIVELKSNFSNKFSNKLQLGYATFRDTRDPFSTPFPSVNIAKDGIRYIVAGHEPFSINNKLGQDVYQITDNFNIYAGDHTITIGGSLEKFEFDNSFNLGAYPGVFSPDYASVGDFVKAANDGSFAKDVAASSAAFKTNNEKNTWALAETNVGQLAFYAQDEWQFSKNLTITAGIRMDKPLYFDTAEKIEENIKRNCCYDKDVTYYDELGKATKFDHTVLPAATPLISPRIGFNLDVKGDKSTQIRGGTGLFTGRFPFVWVGNQVANPNFFFYCVTDPNFKFPQVWRTNLGADKKFDNGWLLSGDLIYTKDINAMIVRNYGLKLPTGKLSGADNRPIYTNADRADKFGPTNAYVFSNTDLGYSFNASFKAEKTFANGLNAFFGYNYTDVQDAASIQAEISSDAYDRNPANIQHTNRPVLAPSVFGNQHRIVFGASQKFVYAHGKAATTFSLFAEYDKGGRYSYTYGGDINNDGSGLNDLLYIPTDGQIDAMKFTGTTPEQAIQKAGFKSYIAQDAYLSANRGVYAEKYANLSPWYSKWDLSIFQDFNVAKGHTIQISFTMLNLGNFISSDWGVRQVASITSLVQPLGVSVANGVPTYSFDTAQKSTFYNDNGLPSRWQGQLGLRYRF
jgi:Carboxypeptidase regulatory-like domain